MVCLLISEHYAIEWYASVSRTLGDPGGPGKTHETFGSMNGDAVGSTPERVHYAAEAKTPPASRRALRLWIGQLGPALALLAVILAFSVLTGAPARYLSGFNLRIVLSQSAIVAVGAIGMT